MTLKCNHFKRQYPLVVLYYSRTVTTLFRRGLRWTQNALLQMLQSICIAFQHENSATYLAPIEWASLQPDVTVYGYNEQHKASL